MAINFGENLKRIRTEKGIAQNELADLLGMHATHLSRYERNVTAPSIEVLKKIADALSVSIDQLVYGSSDQKVKGAIKDQELLSMFSRVQQLDKPELGCVKSLLKAFIFQKDTEERLVKA